MNEYSRQKDWRPKQINFLEEKALSASNKRTIETAKEWIKILSDSKNPPKKPGVIYNSLILQTIPELQEILNSKDLGIYQKQEIADLITKFDNIIPENYSVPAQVIENFKNYKAKKSA